MIDYVAEALRSANGGYHAEGKSQRRKIYLVPFDKIKLSTTRRDLVKGIIPRVGLTIVWGKPKCGKSFWIFDVVMHVALGREYRGRRVHQGPVIYCAFEGQSGLEARVQAFRQERLNGEIDVPFFLEPITLDLIKDHEALIACIKETLGETAPPVAVVLDTLNRSLVGSENSDEDMSAYVRAADAIREAFECAVLVIHHCGYEGTRPRGHSGLAGAADAQISVKRDAEDNIVVELELAKDGAAGAVLLSRLETVVVGKDEDGDDITSCVVVGLDEDEARDAGRAGRGKWPRGLRVVHESITAALLDGGENHRLGGDGPLIRAVDATIAKAEHGKRYLHIGDGDRAEAERKSWQRNFREARSRNLICNELAGGRDLIWLVAS
jgi:hypothetical protein